MALLHSMDSFTASSLRGSSDTLSCKQTTWVNIRSAFSRPTDLTAIRHCIVIWDNGVMRSQMRAIIYLDANLITLRNLTRGHNYSYPFCLYFKGNLKPWCRRMARQVGSMAGAYGSLALPSVQHGPSLVDDGGCKFLADLPEWSVGYGE